MLDLHRSAQDELIVDTRRLLREAVCREARGYWRFRFQLVHFADGLVSCVYKHPRPELDSWLVVFDVRARRIVATRALESTHKLFVRNNGEYLYFGTHSDVGTDTFRRWVLTAYDIKAKKWLDQKIYLGDMVGSDINQSICFEIIDGFFYGLSNQTSFEVDEVDWTSYYHCFRFPVAKPRASYTQRSIRHRMWRRDHAEGPIDDRWSLLRLFQNEQNGDIQVLEARKEWLGQRSSGQRAYYTTNVKFAPSEAVNDAEEAKITRGQGIGTTSHVGSSGTRSNSASIDGTNGSGWGDRDGAAGPMSSSDGTILLDTNLSTPTGPASSQDDCTPQGSGTRLRDPHNTHIGDESSTALLFTFSKCPVRSYHQKSQTFLDLVQVDSPTGTPHLRLRAGARLAVPAAYLSPAALDKALPHEERIRHLYADGGANRIVYWPPDPASADTVAETRELQLLGRIVSPPTHVGACRGAWDERSLVYSTGSNPDGLQAVVFVGFDPAITLQGLKKWPWKEGRGVGSSDPTGGMASTSQTRDASDDVAARTGGEGRGVDPTRGCAQSVHAETTCEDEALPTGACDAPGEADNGKNKEIVDVWEISGADDYEDRDAAAAFMSDVVGETSPAPLCSQGQDRDEEDETSYSYSSPEPSSPQHTAHLESTPTKGRQHEKSPAGCSWAWAEPAMYRQINFGYTHLPDFTQASEGLERRNRHLAAAGSR